MRNQPLINYKNLSAKNEDNPIILAHGNHHHNHHSPQHKSTPKIEKNQDNTTTSSPVLIKIESAKSPEFNGVPGIGESMFILLVIFPFILSSIKQWIHK